MIPVIEQSPTIWLASYPRSGNTFLRTILWHCFKLRSASAYVNDFKGNSSLEEYVGHIEYGPGKKIIFPENNLPLMKTHELPSDTNPAIYVLRDGRAACVSLHAFYHGENTLDDIMYGQHSFGQWSSHVLAWNP